jgi:hypothetical protein
MLPLSNGTILVCEGNLSLSEALPKDEGSWLPQVMKRGGMEFIARCRCAERYSCARRW